MNSQSAPSPGSIPESHATTRPSTPICSSRPPALDCSQRRYSASCKLIHGEINLHEAEYLLWEQSKAGGLLEQIGVDGLVVAWDSGIDPGLGADWEFMTSNEEAAVYHRVGGPFAHVRSVNVIDSRPGESFGPATISNIKRSEERR